MRRGCGGQAGRMEHSPRCKGEFPAVGFEARLSGEKSQAQEFPGLIFAGPDIRNYRKAPGRRRTSRRRSAFPAKLDYDFTMEAHP